MATSSVPSVKLGLLTTMRAAVGTIQCEWAHPGQYIAKESIFMDDAQFSSEEVAALRTTPRAQTEKYTVPVWVDVCLDGNNAQATEQRAYVIVGLIETAIRNAPTLGDVAGLHWAVVAGKDPQNYMADQYWATRITVRVECQARI